MSALVPYFISGGGFAGAVVVAFIMGWIHTKSTIDAKDKLIAYQEEQIDKLEQAWALERQRADAAALTATVTRDVLQALRREIAP